MTAEEFEKVKLGVIQPLAIKYSLKYINLKNNVALVGINYAILFQFGRGETDITYLFLKNKELVEYPFNNFIASSITKEDRIGIQRKEGLFEYAIADLKIIVKGLENHWKEILLGDMCWLEKYKESKYGYEPRISKLPENIFIKETLNL